MEGCAGGRRGGDGGEERKEKKEEEEKGEKDSPLASRGHVVWTIWMEICQVSNSFISAQLLTNPLFT